MKKIIILFSVFFLLQGISQSQPLQQVIKGSVADIDTRQPLPGVNVILLNTEPLVGTTTDMDGRFRLPAVAPGRYTVQVSFMGYQVITLPEVAVTSGKEVVLNLEMKEKVMEAAEVVIIARAEKEKPLNSMTAISARSFSVDETRRYAGSADDPLRAASAFAGVAATASSERNDIVVRGNNPKGLLWRLEGVDIPNPNHFARIGNSGGGLTLFSSQVLANSDFLTSAFPAEYGEALAGVFDIRFRNGNPDTREYTLQLGTLGLDAAAEGPIVKGKPATFVFNYRYSSLALLAKVDKEFERTIPDYQDLSFKVTIPTRKGGTFSFLGIGGIDHSKLDAEEDTLEWKDYEDRQQSKLNTKTGAFIASHLITLGKKSWLKSVAALSGSAITWEDGFWADTRTFRQKDLSDANTTKITGSITLNSKLNQKVTTRAGFTYNRLGYDMNIRSENPFTSAFEPVFDGKDNAATLQGYAQMRVDLTDQLSVNAGVHSRWFEVNGKTSLEPRASVKWQFSPVQSISLGYGRHTQMENLVVYLANIPGTTVEPNKKTGFSVADHLVVGYDLMVNEFTRFKAEAYYQNLSDLPVVKGSSLALINITDQWFADSLTNTGKGKNYGVELTFERFMHNRFYYLITTSLYRSRYTGGDGIERNSRFDGRVVVNGLIGKEFEINQKHALGLNFKVTYSGGEWVTPINLEASRAENRQVDDYSQAWSEQLPGFVYTDLTVTLRRNHRRYTGTWAVQIKNMLNHRPAVGYRYDTYSRQIEEILPMGIVPSIGYKIEF
ncbi:MAG: TonB-dependent receptor [Bacteroidales bacterium]|nr:TonB-dependent receptor [Bacteroidales bacterium]